MTVRASICPRHLQPLRWMFAGGGLLAGAAAVVAVIAGVFSTSAQPVDPPSIAAVVHVAQDMPAPAPGATHSTALRVAVQVGPPVEILVRGNTSAVVALPARWVPTVVASSDQPFPMPAEAAPLTPGAMPWTATRGRVALYCAQSNVVIAAPVPASELPALAGRLPAPS